eukprot:234803-Amorphochlora_amoeboformis.AAC.1
MDINLPQVQKMGQTSKTSNKRKLRCGFCRKDEPGCGHLLKDDSTVYHECCAVYSPMVYQKDGRYSTQFGPTIDTKILCSRLVNVASEIRRGNKLKCAVCKRPGSSIGCNVKSCKKSFHFPCAGKAGCYIEGFALRCQTHGKEHLRARFNRILRNPDEFQPQVATVKDIMLRKADELSVQRGEDEEDTGEEKKQSSEVDVRNTHR